jgi:hypothetical protein
VRPLLPLTALFPVRRLLSLPLRLTHPSRALAVSDRYFPRGIRASQPYCLRLHESRNSSVSPFYVFGPSAWSPDLLCPLLTSVISSRRLSASLAQGKMADLPGYCALTFPLMPAASTSKLSVQVLDFEECCLLIQLCRLLCGFCSSGQRFAYSFLRIPSRDGPPCCSANDSPCRVRRGLSPLDERALPGAQRKRAS